jgi:hypothetical protein
MADLNHQVHGELDLRIGCALSDDPGKRRATASPGRLRLLLAESLGKRRRVHGP